MEEKSRKMVRGRIKAGFKVRRHSFDLGVFERSFDRLEHNERIKSGGDPKRSILKSKLQNSLLLNINMLAE